MKKCLTTVFLFFTLMLGLTSFAVATEEVPTAANYDELVTAMESGATYIEITNVITIGTDETNMLEYGKSLGYDDKTITLIRASDFTDGPMLLIEKGGFKNLTIDGANVLTEDSATIINGNCAFENATFQNCSAGAVSVTSGIVMFDACVFSDNTSESGAHVVNKAESVFTRCMFKFGKAESDGGAIKNYHTLQLQNCTFDANSTGTDSEFNSGGAVYNMANLYAYRCSFTGNNSMQGGALYNFGNAELIGCTLASNSANVGGGINNTGDMRLVDTFLYQNTAVTSAADFFTTNQVSVSFNEDFVFNETPSGWYDDNFGNRSGDKLYDPSFDGNGYLVFLMESDIPAPAPEPELEPTIPPPPPIEHSPATEQPTGTFTPPANRHDVVTVNKPIKPALDEANKLYLVGYRDAVAGENITRSQIAHILYNLMSADSQEHYRNNDGAFSDVSNDIAIDTLAKAKIILGYDEHYRPNSYLTIGEFCTIISRFSDLESGTSRYKNIESHWAHDYVNICVSCGWFSDGEIIDLNEYITFNTVFEVISRML